MLKEWHTADGTKKSSKGFRQDGGKRKQICDVLAEKEMKGHCMDRE